MNTIIIWMFFFYIYCFLGWCFESAFVSVRKRKFINRGFMKGPVLPIYGFGAMIMLLVSIPAGSNLFLLYLYGAFSATVLEYLTGTCMEALFKMKYWDYSNNKFNLQGRICLSSSIAWGGFTILLVKVIHPPIERLAMSSEIIYQGIAVAAATLIFVYDFSSSFKTAIDTRKVIIAIENEFAKIKAGIIDIKSDLNKLSEAGSKAIKSKICDLNSNANEYVRSIMNRHSKEAETFATFSDKLSSLTGMIEHSETIQEIKARFAKLSEKRTAFYANAKKHITMDKLKMLGRNPTPKSASLSSLFEKLSGLKPTDRNDKDGN